MQAAPGELLTGFNYLGILIAIPYSLYLFLLDYKGVGELLRKELSFVRSQMK